MKILKFSLLSLLFLPCFATAADDDKMPTGKDIIPTQGQDVEPSGKDVMPDEDTKPDIKNAIRLILSKINYNEANAPATGRDVMPTEEDAKPTGQDVAPDDESKTQNALMNEANAPATGRDVMPNEGDARPSGQDVAPDEDESKTQNILHLDEQTVVFFHHGKKMKKLANLLNEAGLDADTVKKVIELKVQDKMAKKEAKLRDLMTRAGVAAEQAEAVIAKLKEKMAAHMKEEAAKPLEDVVPAAVEPPKDE